MDTYPLIVNLILEQDDKVLLLFRENTPSFRNIYALPAGKVDKGESLKANLIREASEELGITLAPQDLRLVVVLSATYTHNGKSHEDVGFFFAATTYSGTITNKEPHKHSHLKWFDPHDLPVNTNIFVRSAIAAYLRGDNYVEIGFDQPILT